MFAPHCPTCGHRVLLGTSRLVAADLAGPKTVLVRCFCGTVLDAFDEAPTQVSPPHTADPPAPSVAAA